MTTHEWHYEVFDPKSQWIFGTPNDFSRTLGFYIIELGHFFQDGRCYTKKNPEESFCLSFAPETNNGVYFEMEYPHRLYTGAYPKEASFSLTDNRPGYVSVQIGRTESYFIQFGGVLAETYASMLLGGEEKVNFVSPGNEPFFVEIYDKLVFLYKRPYSRERELYGAMLLGQLITRLILNDDMEGVPITKNKYVRQALNILENRFCDNIGLNEIAKELSIHPSYLSRLIKAETGNSFSAYVMHLRMNHAKKLLISTDISIDEIGYQCGFTSASHFIRLFHQYEKITPRQYRQVMR